MDYDMAVALARVSANLEALTRVVTTLQESIGTYVPREVYASEIAGLRGEVKALKDAQQWVYRIIIGVVVVAVLGLVVVQPGGTIK